MARPSRRRVAQLVIYADQGRTVKRVVRSRGLGDFVAELHDFYVWLRPKGRRHDAGVAVTWATIYKLGVEARGPVKRARKGRA